MLDYTVSDSSRLAPFSLMTLPNNFHTVPKFRFLKFNKVRDRLSRKTSKRTNRGMMRRSKQQIQPLDIF